MSLLPSTNPTAPGEFYLDAPHGMRLWVRPRYDFKVTCIIASLCKEGIVLASDGRAQEIYRQQARIEENAQKIFQLSDHVGVMAYGEGPEDYDRFFTGYKNACEVVTTDKPLDMAFWCERLPKFAAKDKGLLEQYRDNDAHGGLIMAGYNVTHGRPHDPRIVVMQSSNNFEPEPAPQNFMAAGAGAGEIAKCHLAELGDPATFSAAKVSTVIYEAICATADEHSEHVNKNVKIFILRPGEMKQVWPQ